MRKKINHLIIILVVLFQVFMPNFLFVTADATKQPDVCSTPSHMMQLYLDFQKEAVEII